MKTSFHIPIAASRKFAATACLLALVLLWAPVWSAVLSANGLGCCDGLMCAASGHSAKNQRNVGGKTEQSEQPMHCNHAQRGLEVTCDMSCCHPQSQSIAASIQFVLPQSPSVLLPQLTVEETLVLQVCRVLQALDPLSPPPRTAVPSA